MQTPPLPADLADPDAGPAAAILAAVLERFEADEHATVEHAPFAVADDRQAEWAMRKICEANAAIDRAADLRAEWVEQIEAWFRAETRKASATVAFMEPLLKDYALRRRAETGAATLRLPSGTVATRPNPARYDVADPDAFIEWACTSAPDLVRTRLEVDKRALNAAVQDGPDHVPLYGGERVPGLAYQPDEVRATVKPNE